MVKSMIICSLNNNLPKYIILNREKKPISQVKIVGFLPRINGKMILISILITLKNIELPRIMLSTIIINNPHFNLAINK